MLTKTDETKIANIVEGIVQKSIKTAFQDFYDNIFEPFANKIENGFQANDKQHVELKERISLIDEHLLNHEKRITKLEIINKI